MNEGRGEPRDLVSTRSMESNAGRSREPSNGRVSWQWILGVEEEPLENSKVRHNALVVVLVEVIGAWRDELGWGSTTAHAYSTVIVQASACPAQSSIPWGSWRKGCVF